MIYDIYNDIMMIIPLSHDVVFCLLNCIGVTC